MSSDVFLGKFQEINRGNRSEKKPIITNNNCQKPIKTDQGFRKPKINNIRKGIPSCYPIPPNNK